MLRSNLTKADYEALAVFRAALRRFVRFTEEGAREAGITPQQHQVMLAIMGRPGRSSASISEIAEFLQVKHNTAVGLIDRCEVAGLVRREAASSDRRQVQVSLTDFGQGLLERLSERNLQELDVFRSAVSLGQPD